MLLICGACGTEAGSGGGDAGGPSIEASPLERCVLDGGTLKELWSVGNQHGPVTSIVAGSLVVLGAQDGSVKQWSIDGNSPEYGKPFTTAGAPVAALALSSDAHILAATQHGAIAEWKLADASPARTTTIADITPSALAVSSDAKRVVTGTTTGELFDIERASGARTQLASTMWGVSSISFVEGNRLFTAGHWYGTPQIERRAADAAVEATEVWNDRALTGHVRSIAVDVKATTLFAAGDDFVATFAPDQLAAGPLATTPLGEHAPVGSVLLPGAALAATAGSEGTLRIWNVETATEIAMLPIATPIGIAADSDGTRLYTSGPDGRLHAFGCVD